MDGRESGAAGHQDSNGEEYMAVFAYLSIDGNDGLCDTEFASHFFNLHEHFAGHKILGEEALLHCAFVCCDNLYRRIESGSAIGEGAVPLEESQIGNPEFIPQNLLRTGVYSPNTTDYGEFEILSTKPILQETTIGQMKGRFHQGRKYPEEYACMIPNLPEYYRVNVETQEILSMIVNTPARFFMLAGESGAGKTTDSKIIAQALGYPHFVFTCGSNTEEISLMVHRMGNQRTIWIIAEKCVKIKLKESRTMGLQRWLWERGPMRSIRVGDGTPMRILTRC